MGESTEPSYVVEVLLHITKASAKTPRVSSIKPCPDGEKGEMQVA